jgi:TolB protein
MRLLVGACLVVCLGAVVAGCDGSSKGRDDLVFVSTKDGTYELYGMNADGSHQHRLTPDRGNSSTNSGLYYQIEPAWSPDGRTIAFASERDGPSHIFVVDASGKHTRRLTNGKSPDSHPTWSPDGKQIAFARGTQGVIEVMNADGTGVHQVTASGGDQEDPAWSPDGRWIVFDVQPPEATSHELWLVHPDGSDPHLLTPAPVNALSPAWSPDSKRIVFSSDRDSSILGLYTIDVSGRNLQVYARPEKDAVDPAWSPDGTLVAFSTDGAITTATAGGILRQLTNPKDNDSAPAWHPAPRHAKKSGGSGS